MTENSVYTLPAACLACGASIQPSRRRGRCERRFCDARCRSRYHAGRRREALETLESVIGTLRDQCDVLSELVKTARRP